MEKSVEYFQQYFEDISKMNLHMHMRFDTIKSLFFNILYIIILRIINTMTVSCNICKNVCFN